MYKKVNKARIKSTEKSPTKPNYLAQSLKLVLISLVKFGKALQIYSVIGREQAPRPLIRKPAKLEASNLKSS